MEYPSYFALTQIPHNMGDKSRKRYNIKSIRISESLILDLDDQGQPFGLEILDNPEQEKTL